MRHGMKCKKEHKIDCIKDICNGVENGGEITIGDVTFWIRIGLLFRRIRLSEWQITR